MVCECLTLKCCMPSYLSSMCSVGRKQLDTGVWVLGIKVLYAYETLCHLCAISVCASGQLHWMQA